jgi:hypothetical protein
MGHSLGIMCLTYRGRVAVGQKAPSSVRLDCNDPFDLKESANDEYNRIEAQTPEPHDYIALG